MKYGYLQWKMERNDDFLALFDGKKRVLWSFSGSKYKVYGSIDYKRRRVYLGHELAFLKAKVGQHIVIEATNEGYIVHYPR